MLHRRLGDRRRGTDDHLRMVLGNYTRAPETFHDSQLMERIALHQ